MEVNGLCSGFTLILRAGQCPVAELPLSGWDIGRCRQNPARENSRESPTSRQGGRGCDRVLGALQLPVLACCMGTDGLRAASLAPSARATQETSNLTSWGNSSVEL
ncbi:39S ribosomal protein L55, mitochondrial [Platysternon megacephalum]|uniref:39S ribosomal protein L55, mitochondrial n=1 Tax=Platysternon megacephalum TaxID=55544 RepID=A0A4D9DWZ1_9SAUR|nr:39S ribosomal protein L55, mitochondrial [Platysternon megacephalum]